MAKMDEFREEREQIKHAPLSKRIEYFKDYYLVPVLIVIAAVVFAIFLVASVLFKKQEVLYVSMVNFADLGEAEANLVAPFEQSHINTKKEEIIVDRSTSISTERGETNFVKYNYESEQKLLTLVLAGEIDLFVSGEDVVEHYAEQDWFDDLGTILDRTVLEGLDDDGNILYYNGVPIGVSLDDSELLAENYYYIGEQEGPVYAVFPAGSGRREMAVEFLRYLMGE